jgi:hypothetical protein
MDKELDKYAIEAWMPTDGDPSGKQVLTKMVQLDVAKSVLHQQTIQAQIEELKLIWNKTQPDLVPEGWEPETEEGKYILKRIAELEQQLTNANDGQ